MHTNKFFYQFILFVSFLCVILSGASAIFAQDENAAEEFSEVTDTTLEAPSEATSTAPVAETPAVDPAPSTAIPNTAPSAPAVETPVLATPSVPVEEKVVETTEEQTEQSTDQTAEAVEENDQEAESEEKSAEAPQPEVKPMQATTEAAPAADLDERLQHQRLYGDRVFGRSRILIGMNRPTFNEDQKGFDTLYGKPKDYPTVGGDWFPLDWWVNPGLSMRIGGYSVTGVAAKKNTDGAIVPDPNSKTNLLFIPIQGAFKVEMTPFRKKWLVLDGWFGYEYGWWQETTANETASAASGTSGSSTSTNTSKLTSKGTKSATVFGASANILLNGLDERTVRSMIATMGISHVYLSPYFETVKTINKSGLTFGRNIYGIGFTFETLK